MLGAEGSVNIVVPSPDMGGYTCAMCNVDNRTVVPSMMNVAGHSIHHCLHRKMTVMAMSATKPPAMPHAIVPMLGEDKPFVLLVGKEGVEVGFKDPWVRQFSVGRKEF